jgi:hypothetical protein
MQRWVRDVVVALDLCPFAAPVFDAGRVRFVVSDAHDQSELLRELHSEIQLLAERAEDPVGEEEHETTLLVHPHVLQSFEDYNDFLGVAEQMLEDIGLAGVVQIASFHPDYRFAESPEDDPANYTNRSPHPVLHLLREESVSRAVDGYHDASEIPRRNAARLRALGLDAVRARLARCFHEDS